MLLSLRSDHKEHLTLLTNQPAPVVVDFCKLAIDFLQKGPNLKLYGTAAQKLGYDQEAVQNCVYGLVNLLLLSCRHQLCEADFRDSVLTVGFSSEQQSVLSQFYESKQREIQEVLSKLEIKEPHYRDLDWRFEVVVCSRALREQVTPIITMDLQLKQENSSDESVKHLFLQTDPTNLVHVAEELEKALNESRSRHSRKIQRALNG